MESGNGSTRGKRILGMVIADFFIFAALLLTFAYFHHVRVDRMKPVEILSANTPAPVLVPAATPTPEGDLPAIAPVATPDPNDLLKGKYADRFTRGGVVRDGNSYKSENVSVTLEKVETGKVTYYVADIYVRDVTCLRTAVALEHIDFNRMPTLEMATLNGAVAAISGDYFAFRKSGNVAVRNGREWIRKEPLASDILVLYTDGTMEAYCAYNDPDLDAIYARGPYQIWCFGPVLLTGGEVPKSYNTTVGGLNPRAAIGYYEPGHYCFVLVDGRQKNYSVGMTIPELSNLFYSLGCELAFNLDGGDTAVMTFNDEVASHPEGGEARDVSDIIYVAEPLSSASYLTQPQVAQ